MDDAKRGMPSIRESVCGPIGKALLGKESGWAWQIHTGKKHIK